MSWQEALETPLDIVRCLHMLPNKTDDAPSFAAELRRLGLQTHWAKVCS
jgi:hypothetical protein